MREESVPGAMSLTRAVPAAVPSGRPQLHAVIRVGADEEHFAARHGSHEGGVR